MSKSRFQRYWSRVDNSPNSLDHASREQLGEVKRMVKAAFHAGHDEYRKHIAELEAKLENARMAAGETQPTWKHRCYAVLSALDGEGSWGDPDWMMPDEQKKYTALEERLRELMDHIDYTRPEKTRADVLALIGKESGDAPPTDYCECDNTHEQNHTVCQFCWSKGIRFSKEKDDE